MKTVDDLLTDIVSNVVFYKELSLSSRDNKTIMSLYDTLSNPSYITEKQGNLCLQILSQEYIKSKLSTEQIAILENPSWEHKFRIIPEVRKIYHIPAGSEKIPIHWLRHNYTGVIAIEFSFSSVIRNHLKHLSSHVLQVRSGSFYIAEYTERNIFAIMKNLEEFKFEVDPEIQDHYNDICSWNKEELSKQFITENMDHELFNKLFSEDIDKSNTLLLNDRRHRYQYVDNIEGDCNTLTETIARRPKTKLWVNGGLHSLSEVVRSLIELKRAPILFVFEQTTDLNTIAQFNDIINALTSNNITDKIGVYFRLDNTPDGKIFNDIISKNQYNYELNETTQVACVRAGKLPKFFLKESWKPMSIISINNTLRHSKTAIYSKCCDLIITYSLTEPLIETRNTWELD